MNCTTWNNGGINCAKAKFWLRSHMTKLGCWRALQGKTSIYLSPFLLQLRCQTFAFTWMLMNTVPPAMHTRTIYVDSGQNVVIHTHVTISRDKWLISYHYKPRWTTYSVIYVDSFVQSTYQQLLWAFNILRFCYYSIILLLSFIISCL